MTDKIKTLATVIANDLFTAGPRDKPDQAEHAERLVLWLDSGNRELGGWCESAMRDRIEKFLREARVVVKAAVIDPPESR